MSPVWLAAVSASASVSNGSVERPVPPAVELFFTYQTREATVMLTVEVSVPPLPSETV